MVHQKCVFLFQTFEDVSVGIFQRVATVKYGKRYFHSRQNVCAVRRMTATILVVEDDRLIGDWLVRRYIETVIRPLGRAGAIALELFKRHDTICDLPIL